MDDEAVARLADIVSTRIFTAMEKFIKVLEEVVRDNVELQTRVETGSFHIGRLEAKVELLESILHENDDVIYDAADDDDDDFEDVTDDEDFFDIGPDDEDDGDNDPKYD
jgi:hypothetical protein